MKKKEKYSIIEDIIQKNIGDYLLMMGYRLEKTEIVPSMITTEYLSILFTSDLCDICFYYQIFDFRNNTKEVVSTYIRKKPHRSYIIDEIFNYENILHDKNKFCLLNYSGTIEEQVRQFCNYIIELFENYLKDWILGEKWEDIPFDWGPYK